MVFWTIFTWYWVREAIFKNFDLVASFQAFCYKSPLVLTESWSDLRKITLFCWVCCYKTDTNSQFSFEKFFSWVQRNMLMIVIFAKLHIKCWIWQNFQSALSHSILTLKFSGHYFWTRRAMNFFNLRVWIVNCFLWSTIM